MQVEQRAGESTLNRAHSSAIWLATRGRVRDRDRDRDNDNDNDSNNTLTRGD